MMAEEVTSSDSEYSLKKAVLYSFGGFTDVIFLQFFTFLIFTFYFTVVELHTGLISLGFIIWSIWNAFNDPMLGAVSDRSNLKMGRRKPFIIIGLIPLLVVNVLLWTAPRDPKPVAFIYFLIIIIVWEFFYTMYSLNQTSLFPEMFRDLDERSKANTSIQFFQVISLLIAFLLPGFIIEEFDNPDSYGQYAVAAIVISIICAVGGFIFIKFGLKERVEFSKDHERAPSFIQSLRYTFSHKSFKLYAFGNFAIWYAFNMIPVIMPLYGLVCLGESDAFIISLMLGVGFIAAAIFIFPWRLIVKKLGAKGSYILAMVVFIITLMPLMFITGVLLGFIFFFILGFGLAGVLIVRDITIAAIIDEDELNTGVRREGNFYGINGFVVKFSNVIVFLSIALVFIGSDWAIFDVTTITAATDFGLRSLMVIFPIVLLIIGIIAMRFFPIDKEKYDQLTEEVRKLHSEKKVKAMSG
jgi:GPH family glycoside/pentoside/hexuronide:cation symporter